jgi:hypothetical protein|tara:strand:- start:94 stop:234 length:141 start_codon:yes stop_codon:yes gene_type:complete
MRSLPRTIVTIDQCKGINFRLAPFAVKTLSGLRLWAVRLRAPEMMD